MGGTFFKTDYHKITEFEYMVSVDKVECLSNFRNSMNVGMIMYYSNSFVSVLVADPPEYNKMYGIPGVLFLSAYGYGAMQNSFPEIHHMTYLASGICCVGALTGLSSQKSARVGRYCIILWIHFFSWVPIILD